MEITEELMVARRNLATINGYELLEDYKWDRVVEQWTLKFRITIATASEFVNQTTDWYALISPAYPFGNIDIFPAAENSINTTFPHQSFNQAKDCYKWRTGNICVSTSVGLWGKKFFNTENYESSKRLTWHVQRCIEWITAAANETLVVEGDPFELPSYRTGNSELIVFNETELTFQQWEQIQGKHGICFTKNFLNSWRVLPIVKFEFEGREISYSWGNYIKDSEGKEERNLAVIMPKILLNKPWQIPQTWGELFALSENVGVNLREIIEANIFKSGKLQYKRLLLGFPIPKNVGEGNVRMHWMAAGIPALPKLNGFRPGNATLLSAQIKIMFHEAGMIDWINTENWNREEINTRGSITKSVSDLKFLIIGAGAIGSALAEFLVRLGCTSITLIDNDTLAIGNICRHSLKMSDVRQEKVVRLSEHLNSVLPDANVIGISGKIDHRFNVNRLNRIFDEHNVIIDATGEDSMIEFMNIHLTGKKSTFISISTGFAANRLFCFLSNCSAGGIGDVFKEKITPWLNRDAAENPDPEFPREGIGCWHPVFPGRIDDIQMLVAAAIRGIENYLISGTEPVLIVVEKTKNSKGSFDGIRIVND